MICMSSNGNIQVRYDYDVFGKITAVKNGSNQAITDTSSLAFLNPHNDVYKQKQISDFSDIINVICILSIL